MTCCEGSENPALPTASEAVGCRGGGRGRRRCPGGLWITLLFAPWIAYWVLCGYGHVVGVLVGLVLSVVIYVASADRRSVMASTTLCYFALASALTFGVKSPLFVERSGLLGYSVLCAMCFASLALKRPYTYEVSKRDYPEVYWSTPEFFKVNAILTAAWGLIFLVCALLHTLPLPLRLSSHGLIAVGIILSALFPRAYVGWSTRRLVPPYARWRPPAGAREVLIVGAGIGGLSCGALLAKRGYRVTVLEQHYRVGGYCTSFRRGGFTFDAGVESVSGLGPRGPVRWLLSQLGYEPEEIFVRTREAYVVGGRWVHLPNKLDELVGMLCELYPDEAGAVRRFFSEVEAAYREMYKEVELVGAPLPQPLLAEALGPEYLFRYPAEHPTFYRLMSSDTTLRDLLDSYFEDGELKTLLSILAEAYLGTKAEETSAASALPIFGYYIDGGYYPKGGSQKLADLLAKVIEDHGGEVLTGCRVERVLVEGGSVRGVVADGRLFEAPIVVLDTNAMNLPDLVGEENLPKGYVEHLRSLKPSVTAFVVYLGVEMDLSGYPPLMKSVDEGIGIVISSNLDPSLAPEGHACVNVITIMPPEAYDAFGERGTPEYRIRKRSFADELIGKADKLIPGLREHIVVRDAATPKTFERYTLNPRGAIYGLDQSAGAPERPYFKTPIKGLYLVGASTFPGGGVEAVVISGIIAANDVSGWPPAERSTEGP